MIFYLQKTTSTFVRTTVQTRINKMKNIFLICLIFVAYVAQGSNSETVDDVVTELGPQVKTLVSQINSLIRSSGRQIGVVRSRISRNTKLTQRKITSQLGQLDTIVDLAGVEARNKGIDISKCVDAESIAVGSLDKDSLNACWTTPELNLLGIQFGSLGKTKKSLAKSVKICSASSSDAVEVRSCIEKNLQAGEEQSSKIGGDISLVLSDATAVTKACADKVLQDVDKDVSRISHRLKTCLESSL